MTFGRLCLLAAALGAAAPLPLDAQIRYPPPVLRRPPARQPQQPRVYLSVNVGYQDSVPFVQEQTFDQYFEQGTFTLNRTLTQAVFFDASIGVAVWRQVQVIGAFSILSNTGPGELTANVPHPLQFGRQRTVAGQVQTVQRREMGYHIDVGWRVPASAHLEFTVFGGPSIFMADQVVVTGLRLGLAHESFPFDTLAFPAVDTDSLTRTVTGYNAGVDMTWRFTRRLGAGVLIRYAVGNTDFTPPDGPPIEVEVGGLHAGGGLRLVF